jgi:serine/threonine protein kinase/tetratricopeptide (TPR) repeat protein
MNADHNYPEQQGPADDSAPPGLTESYRPPGEGVGTRIGPYKLLQQVGEGGFGVVYMAEQDKPVHRRVACKIIKPGMDSAQVVARFEAERQALALMDHQNIAKVYDAGTTDNGRPFFVMELVPGVPITKYSDDNQRTIRERLALMVPVCKAVQHVHQKGIIHRDLKPSNVLVCLYDGQPVPKVIDFGVAKAMESTSTRLTEHTMFTQYGQIVGTFEYMSPEQAEMSQLGVDTRSDIYSLGVILYQLLTGSTPLERQRLRTATLAEVMTMIKEEDPPKPSTRLSDSHEAAKIAAARRTEPVRLAKLVRGELDWVVMKCLEKDRARRYDTANGLARDIERYLHDEPVEAGPPGTGYRMRKLAGKYRTALTIAGAIVLLLVSAAAVSTWQAVRATRAERRALAERDRAEVSFRMARDTVDSFFTQVGDSPQVRAQGMEKFRKDLLQKAKEFYEGFIQERFDAPEVRHDLGLAHCRLAQIHEVLGDFAAAQSSAQRAIDVLGELARTHPDVPEYRRDLAAGHFRLGAVYFDTGRLEVAESSYRQALDGQERLAAEHPEVAEYRRALALTQSGLGLLHYRAGALEKAQETQEQALSTWSNLVASDARVAADRHGLATAQERLGETYRAKGWTEKAEVLLKGAEGAFETLVREQPDVPEYRQAQGRTYIALGRLYHSNLPRADEAEVSHQQALHIFEGLARQHPDALEYSLERGRAYRYLGLDADLAGRPDVALARYDKAIEILDSVVGRGYGDGRSEFLNARLARAITLTELGEHARAVAEAEAVAAQGGLSEVNLYNLGCFYSHASAAADNDARLSAAERSRLTGRYVDRAMDFLRQAVAKGYQNVAVLKADKDLQPLRSRHDFQELVREVERRVKQ